MHSKPIRELCRMEFGKLPFDMKHTNNLADENFSQWLAAHPPLVVVNTVFDNKPLGLGRTGIGGIFGWLY